MKVYSSGIDNQDLLGYNDNRKVVDDMSLYIRLNRKEIRLAESYAKLHSSTVEDAFKKALFEKIEDEYDAAVAKEAYREYVQSGKKSTPIAELWKELDL